MILQYKGFNNNWCYEEANTIVWSNVWVGKETRDYRNGGCRSILFEKDMQKHRGTTEHNEIYAPKKLAYVNEMHKAVDKLIQKETNCADEIIYLIGDKKFDELENVCVVTLKDKMKYITYVFTEGVYILNNSGGTVQKIA